MKYDVVQLQDKLVAGITVRTNNQDENMSAAIGGLWQKFYSGIYQSIPNKANDKSIGLYTNYESDDMGDYDLMVCCEVTSLEGMQAGVHTLTIPGGKYAKFVVKGDVQKSVGEFWMNLPQLKLDRRYGFDFEEYQSGGDQQHAEIHLYIAIR